MPTQILIIKKITTQIKKKKKKTKLQVTPFKFGQSSIQSFKF